MVGSVSLTPSSATTTISNNIISKVFPHSRPEAVVIPVTGSALDRILQLQIEEELGNVSESGRAS
jgi:hypothetical protein